MFVGDLLQLPPVMPNNSASVIQKLITRCNWWDDVKLYGLSKANRSIDEKWNKFLYDISQNSLSNIKWKDIENNTVTDDFTVAEDFFLDSIDLTDKFPLDRQS